MNIDCNVVVMLVQFFHGTVIRRKGESAGQADAVSHDSNVAAGCGSVALVTKDKPWSRDIDTITWTYCTATTCLQFELTNGVGRWDGGGNAVFRFALGGQGEKWKTCIAGGTTKDLKRQGTIDGHHGDQCCFSGQKRFRHPMNDVGRRGSYQQEYM